MPTYSLSSVPSPACSTGKTKRVSAQLGRLMAGSRGSRTSSEDSRRGVSEDGRDIAACSNNNRMSKAAAWMWYTRSISDAAHASAAGAVVPTHRQLLAVNASSINNSTPKLAAAGAANTQPSRFKQEANPRLASDEVASASVLGAAHDSQYNAEERPSVKLVNHLYDEFELSRLHELLDQAEIDKLHSRLSAQLAPCRPSVAVSTPLKTSLSGRQIKPLSAALHKLFKFIYSTVHNSSTRNSAMETGRPSTGLPATGPRKQLGSVQHVIHHHHHHYHHYRRSSLDSPARDQSPYEPPPHLEEFVRRRRHSYQSCSQAQGRNNNMVEADRVEDDSLCTEDSI